MSDADIRLRAFDLLSGWGTTDLNAEKIEDRIKPWDFDMRLKYATRLANWALGKETANDAP